MIDNVLWQSWLSSKQHFASLIDSLDKHHGAVTALFTILLAVFTYFLWRSTRKLWLSSKAAISHAEDSVERQLRPYISVTKARLHDFELGKKPRAVFKIKNAGQTPAYNFTINGGLGLFPYPFRNVADLPNPQETSRSWIGPKQSFEFTGILNAPLEQKHMSAIDRGDHALLFAASISYTDAFNKTRTAKLRLMYTQRLSRLQSNKLEVCAEGNEET